jgi:hypothetical protein
MFRPYCVNEDTRSATTAITCFSRTTTVFDRETYAGHAVTGSGKVNLFCGHNVFDKLLYKYILLSVICLALQTPELGI